MKKNLTPILVSVGILAFVIFVALALINPKSDAPATSSDSTVKLNSSQQAQLKLGWSKGDANSKVVVTEFGDFQCPACGNTEKSLQATLLPQYGSKINFVFKNFPLVNVHKNALSSTYAAGAAGVQGKFWEMHDKLYAGQDEWSELANPQPKYDEYASAIGLDMAKFKSDMGSAEVKSRVASEKKLAEDINLPGTPSFFVNGVYVDLKTIDDLTNAISKALAQ